VVALASGADRKTFHWSGPSIAGTPAIVRMPPATGTPSRMNMK
jgi:hypothetical protein